MRIMRLIEQCKNTYLLLRIKFGYEFDIFGVKKP